MPYINQPPNLKDIFATLDDRLKKLETSVRFTLPNVATDPASPRTGDAWLNTTTNLAKIVDKNGTVRVISWT